MGSGAVYISNSAMCRVIIVSPYYEVPCGGLPANAVCHSTLMLAETTPSRASPLPQGLEVIHGSVKRMPRAVDGLHAVFTPQLPIALHKKPATACQPLLAAGPIG